MPCPDEFHRGDAERLLPDLVRVRLVRTGHVAREVGASEAKRHEEGDLAVVRDGQGEGEHARAGAAAIGVPHEDRVALGDIEGEGIDQPGDGRLDGRELARLALLLGHQAAGGVEDGAGILALVHHRRRARHPHERLGALARQGGEARGEDLALDRGHVAPARPFSMMQLP